MRARMRERGYCVAVRGAHFTYACPQERYQLHELAGVMASARTYEAWLAAAAKYEDISHAGGRWRAAVHFDERRAQPPTPPPH